MPRRQEHGFSKAHRSRPDNGVDGRAQPPSARPHLVSVGPLLDSLLDVEKGIWSSPELRVVGQEGEERVFFGEDGPARVLLEHGCLVGEIHDYFRNLEKNRCCLTLSGRRKVLDNLRVVSNDPSDARLLQDSLKTFGARGAGGIANGSRSDVVLGGEEMAVYRNALLCALLPVLAAPAPPSPFTPAPNPSSASSSLPSPQDASPRVSFGYSLLPGSQSLYGSASASSRWRAPSTPSDRDSDPLLNRLSASASAFANLEKDASGSCELSPLIVAGWAQAPFDVGPPASAADVDSVTTDMLRELVRVVFLQSETQQLCSEHELRESYGRRGYSEVLARHLMSRLSVLESNSHNFYKPSAFLSPQAYDQWVQSEKQHIKQLLNCFWHYSLPQPSRTSTTILRADHQSAYVVLLRHLIEHQRRIKGGVGVPLSPTASRLLREYGLRFGVGELFRRIVYVEFLSQNMEHEVWYCRHLTSALLSILDLLPAKPSQRTIAVRAELERLHTAMVTLHSHIDHALTRIHYLFPANSPPDGIPSLVQLLSLVLFTQRYLTSKPGLAISQWLRKYIQDSFAWRFDYHKTVSAAELQIVSFVCPITPSLVNCVLVELRNEVLSLSQHFEAVFSKFFSISHLGQKYFYQLLMKDVRELCLHKQPESQLDLEMLALAFRLAELDVNWGEQVPVPDQTWRETFFEQSLTWLDVLAKNVLRWVIKACTADSWRPVLLSEVIERETKANDLQHASPLISGPQPGRHTAPGYASSLNSVGSSVRSAFSRVRSPVSVSALAGSYDASAELFTMTPVPFVPHSTTTSNPTAATNPLSSQYTRAKTPGQPVDIPRPKRPIFPSTSAPVLSFANSPADNSVGLVSDKQLSSSSSKPVEGQPASSRPPPIFRSENLVPVEPFVLHSPDVEPADKSFQPLFRMTTAGQHRPLSSAVVIPTPVQPRAVRAEEGLTFVPTLRPTGAEEKPRREGLAASRTAVWVASVSNGDGRESAGSLLGDVEEEEDGGACLQFAEDVDDRSESQGAPCKSSALSDRDRKISAQSDRERKVSGHSDRERRISGHSERERKISEQSDKEGAILRKTSAHSVRTVSGHSERDFGSQSERAGKTPTSALSWTIETDSISGEELGNLAGDGRPKIIPVSSSLVEVMVLLARLTSFAATLTTVICPQELHGRARPAAPRRRLSQSGPSRDRSLSAPLSSDQGETTSPADTASMWHVDMDVMATVCLMEKKLHGATLDAIGRIAMLYADNMLCADVCGVTDETAEDLVGRELLMHLKEQHEDGCLFGCRHVHMEQRCQGSPKSPVSRSGWRQTSCSHSCHHQSDDQFEPMTLEMCVRINNLAGLAALYPPLQCHLAKQLESSKVPADRDSGLPFSPMDLYDDGEKRIDAGLERICQHIQAAHDGLVRTMAHRLSLFAGQCLGALVELHLPEITLSEHMRPMTEYLVRHLGEIKASLYATSFVMMLRTLWTMLVQLLQDNVCEESTDIAGKSGVDRLTESHAMFLLRVIGHLMQFFHSDIAGLSMDVVVETAQPLLNVLHLHTLSTSSLSTMHAQALLSLRNGLQAQLDLPVETLCRVRRDLHALRKCFSGRQLFDWLSTHAGKLGINESRFSHICQSLLRSGIISPITVPTGTDDGDQLTRSGSYESRGFDETTSSLYRFTNLDECPDGDDVTCLVSRVELTNSTDSELAEGWRSCQQKMADSLLRILKGRMNDDKTARAYVATCAV